MYHYSYGLFRKLAINKCTWAGGDPKNFSRGGGPTLSKKKPITHT